MKLSFGEASCFLSFRTALFQISGVNYCHGFWQRSQLHFVIRSRCDNRMEGIGTQDVLSHPGKFVFADSDWGDILPKQASFDHRSLVCCSCGRIQSNDIIQKHSSRIIFNAAVLGNFFHTHPGNHLSKVKEEWGNNVVEHMVRIFFPHLDLNFWISSFLLDKNN